MIYRNSKRKIKCSLIKMALERAPYTLLERYYKKADLEKVLRTKNILLIPDKGHRSGGKVSYAEWAHVIGIFQTLMTIALEENTNPQVLDIGSGSGLLAIACEPLLKTGGQYTGIDVNQQFVNYCNEHFSQDIFNFYHLDTHNSTYNYTTQNTRTPWNIDNNSKDLVTALSVWTHFNEEDATFYMREIERVLKPQGKAIVTFFLLDEDYSESLPHRTSNISRYHNTSENRWIFDQSCSPSNHWYCPSWVKEPEDAIGITMAGLNLILDDLKLSIETIYSGNWKERVGLYFQDIVILVKK